MSINLGSIFSDITSWIGIGQKYVDKGQAAVTAASGPLNVVVGAVQSLTGIATDLLKKPDPTAEHIAEVDRLRRELVTQANALK